MNAQKSNVIRIVEASFLEHTVEQMRKNRRKIAEEVSDSMTRINREEVASLNHITLMQDPNDVIEYSR